MTYRQYIRELRESLSKLYNDSYTRGDEVKCFQTQGVSNENLTSAWKGLRHKPFKATIEQSCIIFYSKN